ncbi:MAG: HNH endonuclease [Candidatus Nanopelagicales bacterium]|nr:HNH endonuclease [Candidatus Nanopelagicales bacterium]
MDLIAELERLKSAAAAVQARLAAVMASEQSAATAGPASGGTGDESRIARERRAQAALADGEISEWQAMLVARETAVLSAQDRASVDRALEGRLGRMGDRAIAREACRLADLVDPQASARRVRRAEADRRVSVRPAPGPAGCAMARLTATMPVAQAVGAYAALRRHAEAQRGQGDARSLGQLMSDELFARLTGKVGAASIDVEVGLVMSERSLLRDGRDPAVLTDDRGRAFGQVPAALARSLVRQADRAWLSRLYAAPASGELVAVDSRRRGFSGRLRRLLIWRDQTCRMPWCEAPIRHADHVRRHANGGPTGLANGAGLCEACNDIKEATGWRADVLPHGVIAFTTPTGHRYRSHPPPAPGHGPVGLEERFRRTIDDWDDDVGGAA